MSEQHGGEGAGRPAYFSRVFTEQLSGQPCGLNDGVQGCAVLLWNIKSARPPSVDRPPAGKRGVRWARRSDVPQQHTCTNTHMYAWERNILANVPTQDKPVGLHMLTLMDINTYNRKKTLRTWKHSNWYGRRDLYKNIFRACDNFSLIGFCLKRSGKVKFTYLAPMNNEYLLFSLLKQSAKAVNNDEEQENQKDLKKKKTWNCQSPKRNLSLLWKAAKRTTGACRLPSPSGPRSFTRRAVGPQPPLCSPEASLPAQMCSCLCGAAVKAAGLPSTCSKWTDGVAILQT